MKIFWESTAKQSPGLLVHKFPHHQVFGSHFTQDLAPLSREREVGFVLLSTGAQGLMECGSPGTVSTGSFAGDKPLEGISPWVMKGTGALWSCDSVSEQGAFCIETPFGPGSL